MVRGGDRRKAHGADPEYEEIDLRIPKQNAVESPAAGAVINCDLCGSNQATVRCDKCNSQAFCLACDDMYHRHPRRSTHVRKAVEKRSQEGFVKPPLPPKGNETPSAPAPQPPPRKHKRTLFKSEQMLNTPVLGRTDFRGIYKGRMENRPLPPTPTSSGRGILAKAESTGNLALFNKSINHYSADATKTLPPLNLPRAIQDINRTQDTKPSQSVPPTPPSPHSQYPRLQPQTLPSQMAPAVGMKGRKFSLQQQIPPTFDEKRASMVEAASSSGSSWSPRDQLENMPQKMRSQSISDSQWNQMVGPQDKNDQDEPQCIPSGAASDIGIPPHPAKGYNHRSGPPSRGGMMSSASVSDLNALTHFHPQQFPGNIQQANSFQQMNMMRYDGNMMWMAPCQMCQPQSPMYPGQSNSGMKRTTSNLSMNMSSASDVPPGYHPHWGHHHMHAHQMPMYPGYYPGYPPHMMPNMSSMHGSAMSIPDSMHSPAPSVRSSHRSRKSSKSGSFRSSKSSHHNRTRSRRQSEESEESGSMSGSEEDCEDEVFQKPFKQNVPWQCEHCTFINPGHSQTCGMCSKNISYSLRDKGSQRDVGRRKEREFESESNIPDFGGGTNKLRKGRSTRSLRSESIKSISSKRRNKSRVRSSSRSASPVLSENDDRRLLEKQFQELRITPRSSHPDYEGVSISSRGKKHDKRGHYKREGKGSLRSHSRSQSTRASISGQGLHDDSSENRSRSSFSFSDENHDQRTNLQDSDQSSGEPPPLNRSSQGTDKTLVPTISSVFKKVEDEQIKDEMVQKERSRVKEIEIEDERIDLPHFNPEEGVDDELEEEISKKIEELISQTLKLPPGERPHSPKEAKLEPDDPSFANTLDDVDTMATNEVADIDASSRSGDRLEEVVMPEIEKEMTPILQFPKDGSKENQTEVKLNKEKVFEQVLFDNKASKDVTETMEPGAGQEETVHRTSGCSYEQIGEPEKIKPAASSPRIGKQSDKSYESISEREAKEWKSRDSPDKNERLEEATKTQFLQRPSVEHLDSRNKSPSLESFHGKPPSTPDRQCTPISFSSSDAQFYSPPDTPDFIIGAKLREKYSSDPQGLDSIAKNNDDDLSLESSSETASFDQDDPYRTAPFEDAFSPQDFPLARSASDQAISSRLQIKLSAKELHASELENTRLQTSKNSQQTEEVDDRFLTVEELITKRKQKAMKDQGLELVQLLRKAEECGYNPEEVSIALTLCGEKTPLEWLEDNWGHMVDTVMTLATNYGEERNINDIGQVSAAEAAVALRVHKGNIWAAVTECVEERQKKFSEIYRRGNFKREDILIALKENDGNSENAYFQLNKTQQLGSFFKKIWTSSQPATQTHKKEIERLKEGPGNVHADYENLDDAQAEEGSWTEVPKAETGFYSSLFAPLVRRIRDSLQRAAGARLPQVSEDFKQKLTQAVQEWETNPTTDKQYFDSQEELSDDDDEELEDDKSESEKSPQENYRITVTDAEAAKEEKTAVSEPQAEPQLKTNEQIDEVQYIRRQDVVVHPLKAFGHYATMQYADGEGSSDDNETDLFTAPENKEKVEQPQQSSVKVATNEEKDTIIKSPMAKMNKKPTDYVQKTKEESIPEPEEVKPAPMAMSEDRHQEKEAQEEPDEDEEEETTQLAVSEEEYEEDETEEEEIEEQDESLNVTTGRLSLSFTQTSAQEANIDVKSQTIQTQQVAPAAKQEKSKDSISEPAPEKNSDKSIIETKELYKGSGPVTVQKATLIVGKAIAKAMARDDSDDVPDQIEDAPEADKKYSSSEYDSESDDDQGRALDTITEEETGSRSRSQKDQSSSGVQSSNLATGKRPPAVASFSGPIFIPSTPTSSLKINRKGSETSSNKNSNAASASTFSKTFPRGSFVQSESSQRSSSKPAKDASTEASKEKEVPNQSAASTSNLKHAQNDQKKGVPKDTKIESSESEQQPKLQSQQPEQPSKTQPSTVKNKTIDSTIDKPTPSSSRQKTAKATPSSNKNKIQAKSSRSDIIDSSGDSEDEGRMIDDLKSKGKGLEKEKVEGLREQIKMLKQELGLKTPSGEEGRDLASPGLPQEEEEGEQTGESQEESEPEQSGEQAVARESIEEDEQLKFDRTVRRVLAEGQVKEYEKAELVAHLLNLSFDETDSIVAAEECSSIYTAVKFLRQECEICAEKYPMAKMVSMLNCTHRCCYECANNYFSYQIKARNIRELSCPFCSEPNLDECEETTAEYLNNLDILLKVIIDEETHELFQRKLRDWTLMKDPNFRWCNKCSSGFISNPRARKLICPDCKNITCAQCRKQWELQHEGITCEAFEKWQDENNAEAQAEGVAKHLAECGITCPKCKFTYSLAKGGCMHFTCTECKFEFCSGCGKEFKQGAKCPVGSYCERLGLHAHHPRNCLFYLRDKEPAQLQQLLKENNVQFDTEPTETRDEGAKRQCKVQEQKETADGLKDDLCGRVVLNGHAGLCRIHYIEYLVEKINNHGLDPVSIFDEADLRVCLRRNGKGVPPRRWESEKLYRDKLTQLIKKEMPLN